MRREKTGVREELLRNIGFLNEREQALLEQARVAVAGVGGVGGIHLLTLARLGIGRFTIADPETFEKVNINRQFGACVSTLGMNKAQVMAALLADINPACDISTYGEKISADNVKSFLEGADVFVDGIDFFEIEARRLLFREARERGIFALTAAPLGFGATLQVFSPRGMAFDEYFGISDGMDYREKIAAFASGLAPRPYHIRYMDFSKVNLSDGTGPALSLACTLSASLVATEVVKILTGKGDIKAAPHYLQVDLLRRKFTRGYIPWGGKNPLQKLKKRLILRKALASIPRQEDDTLKSPAAG
ncbi:MAG: ThiF family adenylyltransferase [Nitrospirota bacterium]|jgi:molybdopterin/thiamine biosynthesis adenylyltransferase